jgi:histidinol dehydrogenase
MWSLCQPNLNELPKFSIIYEELHDQHVLQTAKTQVIELKNKASIMIGDLSIESIFEYFIGESSVFSAAFKKRLNSCLRGTSSIEFTSFNEYMEYL